MHGIENILGNKMCKTHRRQRQQQGCWNQQADILAAESAAAAARLASPCLVQLSQALLAPAAVFPSQVGPAAASQLTLTVILFVFEKETVICCTKDILPLRL